MTKKELKQDPFLSVYYDDIVEFAQQHYAKLIVAVVVIAAAVVAAVSWKSYQRRQELAANAQLGAALTTFHAYVGSASPDALGPGAQTFATAEAKYKAALKAFSGVAARYPRQKAGEIALYHAGVCEAFLDRRDAALKTLRQAASVPDPEIASLARFALADELARAGRLPEAKNIFLALANHPTRTVPSATAWLALADAERGTDPAAARQIYARVSKQMGSDPYLAEILKEKLAALPAQPGK